MCGPVNRFVVRIINSLDNVRLLANSGIGKNRVSCGQIFQVRLKRTDVDRRTVRDVLRYAERVGDFLNRVEPGQLPNAHAHGVARMDQTIGARIDSTVSSVGISRRPAPRPIDFTGSYWAIADRSARQ